MQITRNRNLILATDGYKLTQWPQYPPGSRKVHSYAEARSSSMFPHIVWLGLQYYIKEFMQGPVVCMEDIIEADDVCAYYFKDPQRKIFNRKGWEYIVKEHGGILPLEVYGIDEGCKIGIRNALFTIENTDPNCWWLTNPLETLLLKTWFPTTVCTKSYFCMDLIETHLRSTTDEGTTKALLPIMLNDFGYRSSTSEESAGLSGMAHLVNSSGSDTLKGLTFARDYYNAAMDVATSVPAMEHSTITSWPNKNETAAYVNAMQKYPTGIISIVIDSYDQRNAIENIFGRDLKQQVIDRGSSNGVLVLRFDSGVPHEVVPEGINLMMEKFGETRNSKDFRVLPSYLRALQGDGMDYGSLDAVCKAMIAEKQSLENIVFGMGGALLRGERDTYGFALKCSNIDIDGVEHQVFKDPKTDHSKASKKGRLSVQYIGNEFRTITKTNKYDNFGNRLKLRFRNGVLYNEITFDEVRENVKMKSYGQPISAGSLRDA